MKRYAIAVLLVVLLGAIGTIIATRNRSQRIQTKIARVQAGMDAWTGAGKDPTPIVGILAGVMPALERRDPKSAESLLDRALTLLGPTAPSEPPPPAPLDGLPAADAKEPASDLFGNPQPVTIEGYHDQAMEPFISPDTQTLFFNNANDPKVDTNVQFAIRTGPLSFRYAGELPGANGPGLDAVPSIDRSRRVYFTSTREYARTLRSIFTGRFDGRELRDVHVILGTLTPVLPGAINMDVCISPDGQTLYMSRARIAAGTPVPRKSDIIMARRQGEEFAIEPRSGELFAHVNTPALEYAPAISADGLELYFTRASRVSGGEAKLRIMVAQRATADAPFDEARVLQALGDGVEGPAVSLDGRELFFHKKVNDRYVIYRATRRVP
jgi:hypothetical protein